MKGFVGGIPIALLAVAAQAMEHTDHGVQGHGIRPHGGGTAMGGPSGTDSDGGFTPLTANIHTHTDVNEFSKDDHSIDVKNKDVFPPPAAPIPYGVALAPGMGPFSKSDKRSGPHGGTAMGGPSGNDEGQVFDMPITGNFFTNVNEESKDDHSIKLKNEQVNPPVYPPIAHPPPVFVHPLGPGFREAKQGAPEHYHVPAEAFEKRWGPEEGGTLMGGPGGGEGPADGPGDGPAGFPHPGQAGPTIMGGPSGPDDGMDFDNGAHADLHTNVNEYSHDDHSVDLKHTDIYPPPPPLPFGPPFKRGWEPEQGGTAMGGPSGDDEGQEFNMPITVDTHTGIHESYADDHSIDVKHKDVYPPPPFPEFGGPGPFIPEGGVAPFRRAYSPSSEERTAGGGGGGTADGGPSGEDDGINFGDPNEVGVDSNVSEHHEDNHAVKIDDTDVHPEVPWIPAPAPRPQPVAVPVPEHEEAPACAPEIHNVVHTVTKTATQVLQDTATVTETPKEHLVEHTQTIHETRTVHDVHPVQDVKTVTETPIAHVVQATKTVEDVETVTETPSAHVVEDPHTVYVTPSEHVVQVTDTVTAPTAHIVEATETVYASPSHVVETQAVSMSHVPMVTPASKILYSNVQSTQFVSVPSVPSSHMAQQSYTYRPASTSAAYSMIPIKIPVASPSSSMASKIMPSGVDPMHSSMASASATPSHGTMFTGDAARLSSGLVSAAAAVMGVLAFIL